MRQLNCVRRCYGTRDTSTESENEAAADELGLAVCSCLDGSTDNDDDATNEDGDAAAIAVGEETTEGEGSDLAELVDDEDDAGR